MTSQYEYIYIYIYICVIYVSIYIFPIANFEHVLTICVDYPIACHKSEATELSFL